ncbi:MAG: hypothetical protein LUF00_10425 [Lachnospiraceae bacterium]|nr:hypothetical protein [Lachnospiraceae bacterium]
MGLKGNVPGAASLCRFKAVTAVRGTGKKEKKREEEERCRARISKSTAAI